MTGRVDRGIVKVGEEVEIVGIRPSKTTVTGVEMFLAARPKVRRATTWASCCGTKKTDVERGQVQCQPGSIAAHRPECEDRAEQRRRRSSPRSSTTTVRSSAFRDDGVDWSVTLPAGTEMVMPGDNVKMTVALIAPIAMEEKLRFAIREGGRTVGAGVVSKSSNSTNAAPGAASLF